MGVCDLCDRPRTATRKHSDGDQRGSCDGVMGGLLRSSEPSGAGVEESAQLNYDRLLAWMAHLGEGSWMSFRRAVAFFSDHGAEQDAEAALARTARRVLSDLGHAAFFVD